MKENENKERQEGEMRINGMCGWERIQETEIKRDEKKEFAPILLFSLAWQPAFWQNL